MYVSYKDQIEFLIVYVREAHPEMLEEAHPTGVVGRPKNIEQRVILATECATEFEFTIPMVIDGMEGQVNEDYKAAPVRVAITDRDGKIVYYAGRGPRDFKLSAVERVLKRLVANKGYAPEPPEPKWGTPVNGLRCGISLDPPDPRIGEDVVAHIELNNTTEDSLGLFFDAERALKNLTLTDDSGHGLLIKPAGSESSQSRRPTERRRGRRRQVYEIKPGDSVFCDVYGNVEAASESAGAGHYQCQFSMTVDANTVVELKEEKDGGYSYPLWAGQVTSDAAIVQVGQPVAESCNDCHGKPDYHHLKSYGCQDCHVGEVGEDDFGTRQEVCAQCHPRPGRQGRLQILGKDGQFNQASRHVYGRIEDSDCLTCHDSRAHKNGVVSLIDPTEDRYWPWEGTARDFCLTCHSTQAPESVSFPKDPTGSGYDKTGFGRTTHAKWLGDSSCAHCHYTHGSPDRALLRGPYVMDTKHTTDSADTDYGLCWLCHDQAGILTESNAFDGLHSIHVESRGLVCATCHDVHGARDQGEAGLIRLHANAQTGFHFSGNRGESSGFEIDVEQNRGSCYVSCHPGSQPRSYARDHKRHTVTCLNCH